jgi:hypothetical protein
MITITITRITEAWKSVCNMTIDTETWNGIEWHECMRIINTRFPTVEFTEAWNHMTCTMNPTGRRVRTVTGDEGCELFGHVEVF